MTIPIAFAFDLEGTLVDVEDAHHQGHLEVAAALGLKLSMGEARRTIPGFVGGGDDRIAAALHALSGTRLPLDEVLRMSKVVYLRRLAEAVVVPRDGVLEFFRSLEAAGIPFALGSLTPVAEGQELLERSGLWKVFADRPRIFREDVRAPKPDPEVFLATARALGVEPREQLVFEDSPVGVLAATRAGSVAIAVPAILDPVVIAELRAAGPSALLLSWVGVGVGTVLGLLEGQEA
jgi:beta-phosphoglucomutase-like phosphatase (HAD superfamily)